MVSSYHKTTTASRESGSSALMVGDAKVWYVRCGVGKWFLLMLLHAEAYRAWAASAVLPQVFQNGRPVLPVAVALVASFVLDNDAGGQGDR